MQSQLAKVAPSSTGAVHNRKLGALLSRRRISGIQSCTEPDEFCAFLTVAFGAFEKFVHSTIAIVLEESEESRHPNQAGESRKEAGKASREPWHSHEAEQDRVRHCKESPGSRHKEEAEED